MKAFFDTHVVVYAHDRRDAAKQARAQAVMEQHLPPVAYRSTTVVQGTRRRGAVRKGVGA